MNWAFLVVAVEWTVIVAIWRRWEDKLDWRVAAGFYLLVLAFLFAPLTAHVVNLPADYLTLINPWYALYSVPRIQNIILSDVVTQFVPWAHQVRESWRHLQIPLWNAAAGGGYPLLGNAQSGAMSPIRILMMPLPLGASFAGEAALKLLFAMMFSYLWAKRRGLSELGSLVTGISFGFSTGLVVWLYFPHSTVAAFIPGIFYLIDRLAEKPDRRQAVALGVLFAVMLYGGHPETAAQGIAVGLAYALFLTVGEARRRWKRVAGMVVLAGSIGLMLAAPFVLTFLESLPNSDRYDSLQHGGSPPSVPDDPRLYVDLVQPRFFGVHDQQERWGPVHAEAVDGYAGMLGVAAWFALAWRLARKKKWTEPATFFVLAAPIAVGIAFDWPVVGTLFDSIPPFSMAANARLRIVLCWLLAAAAGLVVDLVRREGWRLLAVGAGMTVATLAIAFAVNHLAGPEHVKFALVGSIPGLVAIAAVFLVGFPRRWPALVAFAVLAAIVADLWVFGRGWNPIVDEKLLYPETPLIERLQALSAADPIGPSRIVGMDMMFFPNAAAMYGLEDIRAHDPMAAAPWLSYLHVLCGYASQDYFARIWHFEHPIIDFMNVRYALTGPRDSVKAAGFHRVWKGADGSIWKNDEAAPRFFAARRVVVEPNPKRFLSTLFVLRDWRGTVLVRKPLAGIGGSTEPGKGASVETTRAGPASYHLRVQASRPTLVVASLPWVEGWRVRLAGGRTLEPVEVDGDFLGFVVPAGDSTIRVIYRPWTIVAGFWILVAGLVLSIVLAWVSRNGGIVQNEEIAAAAAGR